MDMPKARSPEPWTYAENGKAFSPEWGSEGKGKVFSSGACLDVDSVCGNVYHNFLIWMLMAWRLLSDRDWSYWD